MPTETLSPPTETVSEAQYTHKSFELVFGHFCSSYAQKIEGFINESSDTRSTTGFMGLLPIASVQQMGHRLNEITNLLGDPPTLDEEQQSALNMRDSILLSARYLAWHSVIGGITSTYVHKIQEKIEHEKKTKFGEDSKQFLDRLYRDRKAAVAILVAHNHALRNYFDSELAIDLHENSPERIDSLLANVPYLSENQRRAFVSGISLEIAAKHYLDNEVKAQGLDIEVDYGTDEEDTMGGDVVLRGPSRTLLVDLKSSMPDRFPGGDYASAEDHERGYKTQKLGTKLVKAIVWARRTMPVTYKSFELVDSGLAESLNTVTALEAV